MTMVCVSYRNQTKNSKGSFLEGGLGEVQERAADSETAQ